MNALQTEVRDFDYGQEVFQKISSMWSKDGKSFEPKLCDFTLLMSVKDALGGVRKATIGERKGYNFAPFVGHTGDEEVKIVFDTAKFADTYIVVKWNIQLTKEKKAEKEKERASILMSAPTGGSTSVVGPGAELADVINHPEKIKEILEKAT